MPGFTAFPYISNTTLILSLEASTSVRTRLIWEFIDGDSVSVVDRLHEGRETR